MVDFAILETKRIDLINLDKHLKNKGWISTKGAANVGRNINADYSLACTIRPTNSEIEIFGRLIDAETSRVLATCDVYELRDKNTDITSIYNRFTRKLSQRFPIIEEPVAKTFHRGLIINAGQNANIKRGMKFIAYHREKPFWILKLVKL